MKEIPRNIPTGTGTFGLHSGQKGGKRPLSAAAGRQMEKPAGQWEWPAGRRDRRSNQSKPVAPGGDGSVSAERNSRESGGKERPAQQPAEAAATGGATSRNRWPREAAGRRRRGGAPERPTGRSGRRGATSRDRQPREAAGRRRRRGTPERPTGRSGRRSNRQRRRRPAGQPVETGGPGRRRVGVGGEELPRGRREGATGGATGRGGRSRKAAGRRQVGGRRQKRHPGAALRGVDGQAVFNTIL